MRKCELITRLAMIPGDPEIALQDTTKHALSLQKEKKEEGSSEGIYPDFEVDLIKGRALPKGAEPWISIRFTAETIEA